MGQTTTPTNDAPVTYPDRIYNGKDFDTNINREQSSDNLTTVLTDKNEVLGFPDHTSKQEMQAAIEADRNGSVSTYKPTFYDKFIRQPLQDLGMASFQPPFITDIKPTPERAFATSFARAATADVFKPEFSDQEAKANPIPALAGSLVGSIAAFSTGGALLDGFKLDQLTPFAENIIKGGILGGAYRGVSETSNELRDQDHPDLAKIGQSVLHDALWWGGISGLAGAASKPVGVAASAGLGYLMAKSDGADEPSALLNGAVLGGFHLLQAHGDQEDVRQLVTDKLQSNIADYILSKSPMVHEEVAKQGGREYIANHAEDAIEQANQAIAPQEKTENGLPETGIETPQAKEIEEKQQFPRPEKPIEDGYDPKLLDYLSQYIPTDRLVRLSGTDRVALGKAPESDLESYKMQYDAMAQIISGEKSQAEGQKLVQPEVDRMINEGGKINALNEATKSKTILNQVMKNLTQEIMLKEGDENASQGRERVESGGGEKTSEGETQVGVHLRDNGEAKEVGGEEVANQSQEGSIGSQKEQETEEKGAGEENNKESLPQGQSEVNESGKVSISSSDKNITPIDVENKYKGLSDKEKTTFEEQSKLVSDLINNDINKARRIIRGEEPLPGKMKGAPLIAGMEAYLKKNIDDDISYELANTNLYKEDISKGAQATSLARMMEENSLTEKSEEIKRARIQSAGGEEELSKNKAKIVKKMKKETSKINLSKEDLTWEKFLNDIVC